jgi:hypothetical protein
MIGWLILHARQRRLEDEIDALKRRQGLLPPPPPNAKRNRNIAWLIILAFILFIAFMNVTGGKP